MQIASHVMLFRFLVFVTTFSDIVMFYLYMHIMVAIARYVCSKMLS